MDIEDFGTLHLPTAPDSGAVTLLWSDFTINIIFVLLAAALLLVNLRDYIRLFPTLYACLFRENPNLSLEHNFHTARERNNIALAMLPAFAILVDRFRLYRPSFMDSIPPEWTLITVSGVIAVFAGIRFLFYPLRPARLHGDYERAAHMNLFTCFTVLVPTLLLSFCIMHVLDARESIIRIVLLMETALLYLDSVIMTGRILRKQCAALPTFLYLCALEIIPAVLIVVSGIVF